MAAQAIIADLNPSNTKTSQANALAAIFKTHHDKDAELAYGAAEAEDAYLKWTNYLSDAETSINELMTTHAAFTKESKGKVDALQPQLDQKKQEIEDDIKALREQLEADYESTRTFFQEKLKSEAPLKYWRDRANGHRRAAWMSFGGFAALFAGAVYGLQAAFQEFAYPILVSSAFGESRFWVFSFVAVITGGIVWPLRIMAKLLVSNIHLTTQCSERATIVETYLALLAKDGDIEPAERKLMLAAIFSPMADGIVRDDGSTTLIESVAKNLKLG